MAQSRYQLGDAARLPVVGAAEGAQGHQASLAVRTTEQIARELVKWPGGDGVTQVAKRLELAVVTQIGAVHLAEVASAVTGQDGR